MPTPPKITVEVSLQVLAVGADRLFHLGGEFAGGREHQGADAVPPNLLVLLWPMVSLCSMGSVKAAVLPVPVWAPPRRSWPASTAGIAWAWMGVGVS